MINATWLVCLKIHLHDVNAAHPIIHHFRHLACVAVGRKKVDCPNVDVEPIRGDEGRDEYQHCQGDGDQSPLGCRLAKRSEKGSMASPLHMIGLWKQRAWPSAIAQSEKSQTGAERPNENRGNANRAGEAEVPDLRHFADGQRS